MFYNFPKIGSISFWRSLHITALYVGMTCGLPAHAAINPFTMPTNAYLALAKDHAGYDQQAYLVMAAGRAIYDGDLQTGMNILKSLGKLPQDLTSQKQILIAKISLMRHQPQEAIKTLANVADVANLPEFYQLQYHEILSTGYKLSGNSVESIVQRIKLDNYLHDRMALLNNRRAIWLMLITLPKEELHTLSMEAQSNSTLEGWAKLALIANDSPQDTEHLFNQLHQWQKNHSEHPAMSIIPPYGTNPPFIMQMPKHIALILPQTGVLGGPGNAIVDGFVAENKNSKSESIQVTMYDTAKIPAKAAYKQALNDGADLVIGPLTKNDVALIARESHPVPTILLNETAKQPKPNALEFGLSPTYEAREVALNIRQHGLQNVLIIAPQGSFGETVTKAFINEFNQQGGSIVDIFNYPESNLNLALRDFLKYKDIKAHKHGADGDLPARRRDFDAIFLVAYPSAAREIMPLLRYYDVRNAPIYATSSVYSGSINAPKDKDLDGIIFCDIPWIFNHQMGNRNWPEQLNSYNRLYSIGVESFALSQNINQLLFFPAIALADNSVVYLSHGGQVYHILEWRKFNQGLPELLS